MSQWSACRNHRSLLHPIGSCIRRTIGLIRGRSDRHRARGGRAFRGESTDALCYICHTLQELTAATAAGEEVPLDPKNKVALVTGGGTGLGKEISLKLAAAGTLVAVNYSRSAEEAAETVSEIESDGGKAMSVKADVSVSSDVPRMVDEVVEQFGGIDILINNAGTTVFVPFSDLDGMKEEDWDNIMAVNLRGPFLCSKIVAPIMKDRGAGKIINVTSTGGIRPGGSCIAYSVSKAAEDMLGRCLAVALAPEIQVNNVAPGLLDTRWGRKWGEKATSDYVGRALLGRLPQLDDVADAALYLVRNDSVTSQTVVVDGGVLTY